MDSFHVLPVGSIYAREETASVGYLDTINTLPASVKGMISSIKTAAHIRGMAKTYDIPEEKQPNIAFAILEISIGKKKFNQLPAVLSTELGLSNDAAQKMADEIEHDVFGPIRGELDAFVSRKVAPQPRDEAAQKEGKGTRTPAPTPTSPNPSFVRRGSAAQPHPTSPSGLRGARNLLDLKEIAAAKRQEQLTAKPQQKILSPQAPKLPLPARAPLPRASHTSTSLGVNPNPPAPPKFPLPPRAPHPSPLPEQERGTTPPESPINFTGF